MTTTNTTSSLLELPPELRNYIYELVLVEPSTIKLVTLRDAWDISKVRRPTMAGICKQIRQEALPIYYERNTFELYIGALSPGMSGPNSFIFLRKWLGMIGAANIKLVKRVIVSSASWLDERAIRLYFEKHSCYDYSEEIALYWEGVTEDRLCDGGANNLFSVGVSERLSPRRSARIRRSEACKAWRLRGKALRGMWLYGNTLAAT